MIKITKIKNVINSSHNTTTDYYVKYINRYFKLQIKFLFLLHVLYLLDCRKKGKGRVGMFLALCLYCYVPPPSQSDFDEWGVNGYVMVRAI